MRRRCRRHDSGGRCQRKQLPIGYFLSRGPFDGRGSSSWSSDLRLPASVKTMLRVNEVPENTPGCPKCTEYYMAKRDRVLLINKNYAEVKCGLVKSIAHIVRIMTHITLNVWTSDIYVARYK